MDASKKSPAIAGLFFIKNKSLKMANWQNYRISDCVENIEKSELVLPVVQRDFVWTREKIELLFDTLLKGDSFGGIMTIKDLRGKKPIFSFRPFIRNYSRGDAVISSEMDKLKKNISYIVDGQQRLSAFYIGLKGDYEGNVLYLDLLSEFKHRNFNLKFSGSEVDLKKEVDDYTGSKKIKAAWYSIPDLYRLIEECGGDYHAVFDEIEVDMNVADEEKDLVKINIENFTNQIFNFTNIGVCEVGLDRTYDEVENRLRVVELFRRLNQGGTKLDGIELVASKLKGFDARHERFLRESEKFEDIGFGRDEILKLVFILQDDHKKSLVNITKDDSDFILENKIRIGGAIEAARNFLKYSELYEYYISEKPSVIPLYFIVYHVFHANCDSNKIPSYFDNYETNNKNYVLIFNWVYLSMINRVFRRKGAGWIAYSTGIRKILLILKKFKGKDFPINEVFDMYEDHPLDFSKLIRSKWINDYDFNFLFFLLYGKPKNFRVNDIDHIHPKSILAKKGVEVSKINCIENFQLLDFSTNRRKNASEFGEWVEGLDNEASYCDIHFIPSDKNTWGSDEFDVFIEKRSKLISKKLRSFIID